MTTKEEFEKGYCERSGLTIEEYHRNHVTLPCACDFDGCEGWARIINYPDIIADHKLFHTPKGI